VRRLGEQPGRYGVVSAVNERRRGAGFKGHFNIDGLASWRNRGTIVRDCGGDGRCPA
jgi:hypothetical protein